MEIKEGFYYHIVVKKYLENNLRMHEHGVNLFFADIDKIYELMLAETGK